jgi:hypothetical protein
VLLGAQVSRELGDEEEAAQTLEERHPGVPEQEPVAASPEVVLKSVVENIPHLEEDVEEKPRASDKENLEEGHECALLPAGAILVLPVGVVVRIEVVFERVPVFLFFVLKPFPVLLKLVFDSPLELIEVLGHIVPTLEVFVSLCK